MSLRAEELRTPPCPGKLMFQGSVCSIPLQGSVAEGPYREHLIPHKFILTNTNTNATIQHGAGQGCRP